MSKINKKSMILGLILLAYLAFWAIVMPLQAKAANNVIIDNRVPITPTLVDSPNSPNAYSYSSYSPYGPYPYQYQYPTPSTNFYGYYQQPSPVVYNVYPTPSQAVYYNEPTSRSSGVTLNSSLKSSGAEKSEKSPTPGNELVAGAIYGKSGFMPSGLIQWIFVAVLILFIVILARIVFGGAKKYYSQPLKHE